jgi:LysR family transcriptional regulator, glycine cleavage system transcriptional activator
MNSRLPTTQSLSCFEASARLGSFSAAARELFITQGAVSRQLQSLESLLGVALFLRSPGQLQLTDAGQVYLTEVREVLLRLDRSGAQMRLLAGRGGVLNLSIPSSWGIHWLIPRLPDFSARFPQFSLNLSTQVGIADFTQSSLDAAVEYRSSAPAQESQLLMALEMFPYASPKWFAEQGWNRAVVLARPGDLLQHTTTLPDTWKDWLEAEFDVSVPVRGPRFELMSMCMSAVVQGLGVALLPTFMAAPLVQARKLKRLSSRSWQAPGGYYLRAAPMLKSAVSFAALKTWLIEQGRQT